MRNRLKRIFDLTVSLGLLAVLFPLLLCLALLVRLRLGTPIIFCQSRPGRFGRSFKIFKFRTMLDRRDETGNLLPDGERLTDFGKWLRSTSLDELPELWNVVLGNMSLVGPRPLLEQYLPLYSERQRRRHEVKPGITGWAQINGRNAVDWPSRLEMDVWYVENQSIWLDLKILYRTIWQVLFRKGITAAGHDTCPPFRGNSPGCDNISKFVN